MEGVFEEGLAEGEKTDSASGRLGAFEGNDLETLVGDCVRGGKQLSGLGRDCFVGAATAPEPTCEWKVYRST